MDRFRKNYTPITDEQKALGLAIKEKAEELEALFEKAKFFDHRLGAIAQTELEGAVMWACKAAFTAPVAEVD